MNKEFVMRGQTASGETELLEFGGRKPGYGYIMTEFKLWPSTGMGTQNVELAGSVTAAKTSEDPANSNFNNEGLIANALYNFAASSGVNYLNAGLQIVNDTFLITQNLILAVVDTYPGAPQAVNWHCRFEAVKLNSSQEAVANYKQFNIFDD